MIKRIYLILTYTFLCITCFEAQEVGNATFYHRKLHGHRTSDGGTYNNDSLTCAHRTYKLGTFLKVTNIKNNKSVIVKVTDRGPYSRRLMIDLSYRAAKEIDIIRAGIAPVEVIKVEPPTQEPTQEMQSFGKIEAIASDPPPHSLPSTKEK